jgi:hypothetical protein
MLHTCLLLREPWMSISSAGLSCGSLSSGQFSFPVRAASLIVSVTKESREWVGSHYLLIGFWALPPPLLRTSPVSAII